jgi:hypothetical protein
MKKIITVSLFLWYFGMRALEGEVPGLYIQTIVGPFNTLQACETYRKTTKEQLERLIDGLKVSECTDMKGTSI